jgi:hypothetical protein
LFPPAEAALIAHVVARDLLYYDPTISEAAVAGLCSGKWLGEGWRVEIGFRHSRTPCRINGPITELSLDQAARNRIAAAYRLGLELG